MLLCVNNGVHRRQIKRDKGGGVKAPTSDLLKDLCGACIRWCFCFGRHWLRVLLCFAADGILLSWICSSKS